MLYYVVLCCVVYHVMHIMDDSLVYHVQSYLLVAHIHIHIYIYAYIYAYIYIYRYIL